MTTKSALLDCIRTAARAVKDRNHAPFSESDMFVAGLQAALRFDASRGDREAAEALSMIEDLQIGAWPETNAMKEAA